MNKAIKGYEYTGDINIKHGGAYVNYDDLGDRYCRAVMVTDFDSDAGVTDCVLIEELTINLPDTLEALASCLECSGFETVEGAIVGNYLGPVYPYSPEYSRIVAECCLGYGHYDIDDRSEGILLAGSTMRGLSELAGFKRDIASDGCTFIDGFKVHRVARSNFNLRKYIEKNWLN
jgi:hypothetical protein